MGKYGKPTRKATRESTGEPNRNRTEPYGIMPWESTGSIRGAYGRIHRKLRGEPIGRVRGAYWEPTGEYIGKYGKYVPPVTPHAPALHATPRSPLPHFPPPRPTWGHPNGPPPPTTASDTRCATGATGESTGYTGEGTRSNPCSTRGKWRFQKNFPYFPGPSRIFPYFTISVKEPPGQRPCFPRPRIIQVRPQDSTG